MGGGDGLWDDTSDDDVRAGNGIGALAGSVWLDSEGDDDDEELPSQRRRDARAGSARAAADGVLPRLQASLLGLDAADESFGGPGTARVIGVDLLPVAPVWGVGQLRGDFGAEGVRRAVRGLLPGGTATAVVSDMAHSFVGDGATDTARQTALAWEAAAFAAGRRGGWGPVLRRGGSLVLKVRAVGDPGVARLLAALEEAFGGVTVAKPAASRADSAEAFVVARGFRGRRIAPTL